MQWIQYVFSFSTLLTKHRVFVGQQNNPKIPRNLPAGTARPGFEIPGSTTDPLIIPPFNQVYLNHKLLTGMKVLIGVLRLPALGSHPLLPGGDFL